MPAGRDILSRPVHVSGDINNVPTRRRVEGIVVSAAVDYIAASGDSTYTQRRLTQIGQEQLNDARLAGNKITPWSRNGYVGKACGSTKLASKPGSTIISISGAGAGDVCRDIVDSADNVSRIDLQTTVRFDRDVSALARRHVEEFRRSERERVRKHNAHAVRGFERGDSFYIGSRVSNYYGRVYDKYRESGVEEYKRCWRYEVECKGDGAHAATRLIKGSAELETDITQSVHSWFTARGIEPGFRGGGRMALGKGRGNESSAEISLKWLNHAVSPVVRRLLEWYSEDDLIAILFGRLVPKEIAMRGLVPDSVLAAYDEQTVASGKERMTVLRDRFRG